MSVENQFNERFSTQLQHCGISGYVGEEKIAIARQYLIPQSTKESGVSDEQIEITDNALLTLIKSYCRESGVRNLQKHIEKV